MLLEARACNVTGAGATVDVLPGIGPTDAWRP